MFAGFEVFALIAASAFLCEYIDSALGMGYGTTLTPILLIAGYEPLQIVPAVLFSEFVTGILAAFAHHRVGNVSFVRGSKALKVALALAACSIIGTVFAVAVAVSIPKFYLNLYIGLLVLSVGVFVLLTINSSFGFSWKKIVGLGVLAAFNKGMSGGGYGPLVTGGQLLTGVDGKNAIGITSLAEGLTCLVGIVAYLLVNGTADFSLMPALLLGAVLSVPFAALSVKITTKRNLKLFIGALTIILGIATLAKLFA